MTTSEVERREPTAVDAKAGTDLAELPRCVGCDAQLVLRAGFDGAGNGHTAEQRSQGIWYDHPPVRGGTLGHSSTFLFESPALQAQLAEQRAMPTARTSAVSS